MNAPNFKGIIFEYFALTNIYVHGHDINMYMKMTRTSMPLISTTENRELVSQRSNLVVCGFKIWWIEKRIYIGLEKTSNWFFFNFDHLIGNNGWLLVKKASLTPKSMGSRSMKFKENSPIMIQGILKGNSWKISIFKSTSRVTFLGFCPHEHLHGYDIHENDKNVDAIDLSNWKQGVGCQKSNFKLTWILKICKDYPWIFLES